MTLLTFLAPVPPLEAQGPQNQPEVAFKTLTLINAWRIENDLWPLKQSPTLETMALAQALYVLPFVDKIENYADYHTDAQKRNPRQRAAAAPYLWPNYGRPDQIEVGENTGVGSPEFAMNFWKHSDIHARTALSSVYREVGVVAIPHKKAYVIYVVFGARPGVFPAQLDPTGKTLFLTTERSKYSKIRPENTKMRIFDTSGAPLTAEIKYQVKFDVPEGKKVGSIVYTANGVEIKIAVDSTADVAVMPGKTYVAAAPTSTPALVGTAAIIIPTSAPTSIPTLTPSYTPTRRPISMPPTNTPRASANRPTGTTIPSSSPRTALNQATETSVPPTGTPRVVAAAPTITMTATLAATRGATLLPAGGRTPTPSTESANELIVIYTTKSLTLYNASRRAINLSGITVGSDRGRLTTEFFLIGASFPIAAFPPGHCVQANVFGSSDEPPGVCGIVRSQVQVSASRQFWILGTFQVQRDGKTLATCEPGSGRCEVDLDVK